MKVVWTDNARDDLADIGGHIAQDHPARAGTFVDEIIDRGDAIADLPLGFPIVQRFERFGVRRRSFGRYLIFYRVIAETVEILHVLHAARDHMRVFATEGFGDE